MTNKTLPPFEAFETGLAPELEIIHEYVRPGILFKIYELAKRKAEMEVLRKRDSDDAPRIRTSIKTHAKILTQIQKAIGCIEVAKKVAEAEDAELLANLDVIEAQRLLDMAANDIIWLKDQMLPGAIRPALRNERERSTVYKVPAPVYSVSPFPGFGFAEIDYWFIGELDKALDNCVTPQRDMVRNHRDQIIKKVFKIAFSETHEIGKIKNARLQMARKRRKKP